jgi:dimethylaniline monooxygenase (N-oxide forming)
MDTVAIVGAGPSGLVAARWLKKEGFEPVLFEQGESLGGQWSGDAPTSGVWPAMRTNTSRVMSAFSDLSHPPGTPVYPTNQSMLRYLKRYAETFDLISKIRANTLVQEIHRNKSGPGWVVRSTDTAGKRREDPFARVIIATGRFHQPMIPEVPGLRSFSGTGGVNHTFAYKDPDRYRGLRVLVAGGSISALEIAGDLAMLGAARVVTTNRRQRYVVQKLLGGVPAEYLAFTRFGVLSAETFPREVVGQQTRDFITRVCGSPEQFGAPKPSENLMEAGITLSQHYLPLVAEGRITCKPWIAGVDGGTVRFADGSSEEFDAILFGTGFAVDLPLLSDELRRVLDVDPHHVDLYHHTFHPDLPGLAFAGLMEVLGPYYPTVELQARWIAYLWSGALPELEREEMEKAVAAYRARRCTPQAVMMHMAAIQFARKAGIEPQLEQWPQLARALLFGPLTPVSFRLQGRDSLSEAPQRAAEEAAAFGAITTARLTREQAGMLAALAAARNDPAFSQFVKQVLPEASVA